MKKSERGLLHLITPSFFTVLNTNRLVLCIPIVEVKDIDTHNIMVTVRFGETDALGHINNTSYFIYLEEARIRFIETLGYKMDSGNWNFILASTKCDFIKQGYFDQRLLIKTYVSKIGNKSFQLEHDIICSQSQELIAKGNAIMVYFDFEEQMSKPIPDFLKEELKNYLVHL
jgi:acyl-CoA thioester hydrolase